MKYLTGRYDSLAAEVNEIAHAKVLTLAADEVEPSRFSYSGADVQDGKLRMVFNPTNLGVNIDYCLQEQNLLPALNKAPTEKPISFSARLSIRGDYEPTIKDTQHALAELLGKSDDEIKLNPSMCQSEPVSVSPPFQLSRQLRLGTRAHAPETETCLIWTRLADVYHRLRGHLCQAICSREGQG